MHDFNFLVSLENLATVKNPIFSENNILAGGVAITLTQREGGEDADWDVTEGW